MSVVNIEEWMNELKKKLLEALCRQVVFIGLQGSYARGEATADSDIDVVVLFRFMTPTVLRKYRSILGSMPYSNKVCGFVGGREELRSWNAGDLFQLYYDTKPVYNDLHFIADRINVDGARQLVHTISCNIYHECCHNMLHAKDRKVMAGLYKPAAFAVQAKCFISSGEYVHNHRELAEKCTGSDKKIAECAKNLKTCCDLNDVQFDDLSMDLLEWSGENIIKYANQAAYGLN